MTTERKYEEVKTDFFKFEKVNDTLHGTLAEKSSQQFREGVVGRYKLAADDGKMVTFLGNVSIDDLLESVEIGTYIRLTFVGNIQTKSGMTMKNMKLEVASS